MSDQSRSSGENSSRNDEPNAAASRRGFIQRFLYGVALAGTTVLPAWATGAGGYAPSAYARGRGRVPKRVAHYQYHPNGPQHCGACVHFRPPGRCEIVAGQISADGWCRYFRSARARRGSRGSGGSY
jgi:hypothetical protein